MGIYHVDASSRLQNSVTRKFSKYIVNQILESHQQTVTYRDIGQAEGLKFVDDTIVSGLFIPEEKRSEIQKKSLQPSDDIISEAFDNDIWVIGLPIYNFSAPATFKAWADMLARAQKTFKYTEQGPIGLLENKKVFTVIASGGTKIDSEIDFCTPWLRQFMKFLGIPKIEIIKADLYSEDLKPHIERTIDERLKSYDF